MLTARAVAAGINIVIADDVLNRCLLPVESTLIQMQCVLSNICARLPGQYRHDTRHYIRYLEYDLEHESIHQFEHSAP